MVREGRIQHVLEMGTFMPDGSRGDKYAVSLFPHEKVGILQLVHFTIILAARISVGFPNKDDKRILKLS